ncbi:hypothetical protein N9140_00925 [bacterium]|nr:hypothetical protein [bacterium]
MGDNQGPRAISRLERERSEWFTLENVGSNYNRRRLERKVIVVRRRRCIYQNVKR